MKKLQANPSNDSLHINYDGFDGFSIFPRAWYQTTKYQEAQYQVVTLKILSFFGIWFIIPPQTNIGILVYPPNASPQIVSPINPWLSLNFWP